MQPNLHRYLSRLELVAVIQKRNIVEYCDYCRLEVKVTGFKMDYMDSKKIFCCEGCKAIYTLFGDAHVVKNTEHVASSVSR